MGVIDTEIQRIRTTDYGEDMRDAIGDAMEILNTDASGAVHFDAAQNLTAAQQQQARGNIGAVADNQGSANAGKALVVRQNGSVTAGNTSIPADVKTALLACFQKVAWIDTHGQDYYGALYAALYSSLLPPAQDNIYLYHFNNSLISDGNMSIGCTAVSPVYDTGKFGKCIKFTGSGTDQILLSTNVPQLQRPTLEGDFTIAMWVNLYATDGEAQGLFFADNLVSATGGQKVSENLSDLNPVLHLDNQNYKFANFIYNTTHTLNVCGICITFPLGEVNGSQKFGVPYVIFTPSTLNNFYAVAVRTINEEYFEYMSMNSWHHVALCRKNGDMTLYVNGIKIWTVTFNMPIYKASHFILGGYWNNENPDLAYRTSTTTMKVDELYVNDSRSIYDGNFTPPTQPYDT